MKKAILLFIALGLSPLTAVAQNNEENPLKSAVEAALEAEVRTEQERDRDRNRRPYQTLEFFGLKQDMKVLELFPGGGWYTKVLAPVLRDTGELHVAPGV